MKYRHLLQNSQSLTYGGFEVSVHGDWYTSVRLFLPLWFRWTPSVHFVLQPLQRDPLCHRHLFFSFFSQAAIGVRRPSLSPLPLRLGPVFSRYNLVTDRPDAAAKWHIKTDPPLSARHAKRLRRSPVIEFACCWCRAGGQLSHSHGSLSPKVNILS